MWYKSWIITIIFKIFKNLPLGNIPFLFLLWPSPHIGHTLLLLNTSLTFQNSGCSQFLFVSSFLGHCSFVVGFAWVAAIIVASLLLLLESIAAIDVHFFHFPFLPLAIKIWPNPNWTAAQISIDWQCQHQKAWPMAKNIPKLDNKLQKFQKCSKQFGNGSKNGMA